MVVLLLVVVVWSDAILFFLLLNRFSRIQSYLEYKMMMLMNLRTETEPEAINQSVDAFLISLSGNTIRVSGFFHVYYIYTLNF